MKSISIILVLICSFVVAHQSKVEVTSQGQKRKSENDIRQKFVKWKQDFRKTYKNKEEEAKAQANFAKNTKDMEAHNARKNVTFKMGVSYHSDMSYKEKKVKRMGLVKLHKRRPKRSLPIRRKRDDPPPPNATDFRPYMTAIKNQVDCGACWAFSSTAVLEYQIKNSRNVSIQLSEQELIDCNTSEMDCDTGGWPTDAYNYVIKNGLGSADQYEFLAYNSDCLKNRIPRITRITDTCELDMGGDEDAMKWLVANYGPVAVTIWATQELTQYRSGVFSEEGCPTDDRNHAIVIVGYGTDKQFGDFWWIRNSWGASWGYSGYGKYARNKNNMCGICDYAMFPCNTEV